MIFMKNNRRQRDRAVTAVLRRRQVIANAPRTGLVRSRCLLAQTSTRRDSEEEGLEVFGLVDGGMHRVVGCLLAVFQQAKK